MRLLSKQTGSQSQDAVFIASVFYFETFLALVRTDNGSEFTKQFEEEMNAHVERFNRTLQEEFLNYHKGELLFVESFNRKLID